MFHRQKQLWRTLRRHGWEQATWPTHGHVEKALHPCTLGQPDRAARSADAIDEVSAFRIKINSVLGRFG